MKKILLLSSLSLAFFTNGVKAQDKGGFKLGVGPVAALPFGDFHTLYSFGVGGEVQASYGITDNIAGFIQSGYTTLIAKTVTYPSIFPGVPDVSQKAPSNGLIPSLIGARYHHSSGFSVGAGIGYGKFTASGASGGFAYSPQIGYSIGLVDIIAYYTGVSASGGSYSSAGLKVFINFIGNNSGSGGGGRW